MLNSHVLMEWQGSGLWDVYELISGGSITLITTEQAGGGGGWSYYPTTTGEDTRYWVLAAGSPAPTDEASYMARILGVAAGPVNMPSPSVITGTSSLSAEVTGGLGIPELCWVYVSYASGANPPDPQAYTGSTRTWSCAQNAGSATASLYISLVCEEWGAWPNQSLLAEAWIDYAGSMNSYCEGFDKIYVEASGYGQTAETGRDVNSTECGYTPPDEPPPEPPVDPDNDGDGVPASSDPDDNDPNNPNGQP
jgi:hypothetical protein